MRFSAFSAVAIAAFSSVVLADATPGFDAISVPTLDQVVAAGASLDITWQYTAAYPGSVTITLLQGATTGTLSLGDVVKAGVDNSLGKYTWTVPASLQSFATYGFQISYDNNTAIFQYSYPFHITGLGASATTTSALTGPPVTTTVRLTPGTAYTTSTSCVASNTSTIVTSTAYTNTSTSTYASATFSPSSNLSTIIAVTTVPASKTSALVSTSATGTPLPARTSASAAAGNIARGSMALFGGLVLAFAL